MQPGERLRKVIEQLGWTQTELAEPLDVSNVTVSRWVTKARAMDQVTALAIQALTGANSRWLMHGEEPMWLNGDPGSLSKPHPGLVIERPRIQGFVTCGPGGEIQDPGPSAEAHPIRTTVAQRLLQGCGGGDVSDLFWLKVAGDSMAPTLQDGELVLIHAGLHVRSTLRNHGVYLVRRAPTDADARVKRLRLDLPPGQLTLVSDNRAFAPVTVDPDGIPLQQLVLGRVVLLQRQLLDLDPAPADW